jgi:hypothetical protein
MLFFLQLVGPVEHSETRHHHLFIADMLSDLLLNDRGHISSVAQPDNVVLDFDQLETGKKFQ